MSTPYGVPPSVDPATVGPLAERIRQMFADATVALDAQVLGSQAVPQDGAPTITVKKLTGFLHHSLDAALDAGAITEDEARAQGWTPPPPVPWHRRARWRWAAWREHVGRRVGGWIAGMDLSERDDDW